MLIKNKANKKLGSLAISQIILLILGTIAVAYIIGSEIKVVSAAELSFTFKHPNAGPTSVEYSDIFTPASTTGLPSGDFSFFTNPAYTGAGTPGAGFVAYDGTSVYYLQKGVWQPYKTADIVGEIKFVPSVPTTQIPPQPSGLEADVYKHMREGMGLRGAPSLTPAPTTGIYPSQPGVMTGLPGTAGAEAAVPTEPGFFAEWWKTVPGKATLGKIVTITFNALQAVGLYFGVKWALTALFPNISPEAAKRISIAAGVGYFVGKTFATQIAGALGITAPAWVIGLGGAAILGVIAFVIFFKVKMQETFLFNCYSWQPPSKGEDCKRCGQGILPCSKYECESLGQGCEFLDNNIGTEDDLCVWKNPNDIDPPTIEPWTDALQKDYKYQPYPAVMPGDEGVIVYNKETEDGCVPPYEIISFGVELNKVGRCKYDVARKDSFESMVDLYLSQGSKLFNHSTYAAMPGVKALEAGGVKVENDGWNEIYVRCESTNGYANVGNFVFRFCMSKEPDRTPPRIEIINPIDNSPIQTGTTSINVELYLNKPSECKWDHLKNKNYENMEGTFSCATDITEMNVQMLYKCSGTLTGLIDNTNNKFYFRCRQTNTEGETYEMAEPREYTLIGTRPLVIDWVKPDSGSVVKGSTDSIKVTIEARTSAGYEQGKAVCEYNQKCYKTNGNAENYIQFGYPSGTEPFSQYQHSQNLWLPKGTYECSIKCMDKGGNIDTKITTYSVETDTEAPLVVRAYHDESYLKIITNEPSTCHYDIQYENSPCDYNFEDGIKMTDSSDKLSHTTGWNTRTNFYIKCKDDYGNEPYNYCSIIVRPSVI